MRHAMWYPVYLNMLDMHHQIPININLAPTRRPLAGQRIEARKQFVGDGASALRLVCPVPGRTRRTSRGWVQTERSARAPASGSLAPSLGPVAKHFGARCYHGRQQPEMPHWLAKHAPPSSSHVQFTCLSQRKGSSKRQQSKYEEQFDLLPRSARAGESASLLASAAGGCSSGGGKESDGDGHEKEPYGRGLPNGPTHSSSGSIKPSVRL